MTKYILEVLFLLFFLLTPLWMFRSLECPHTLGPRNLHRSPLGRKKQVWNLSLMMLEFPTASWSQQLFLLLDNKHAENTSVPIIICLRWDHKTWTRKLKHFDGSSQMLMQHLRHRPRDLASLTWTWRPTPASCHITSSPRVTCALRPSTTFCCRKSWCQSGHGGGLDSLLTPSSTLEKNRRAGARPVDLRGKTQSA